MDKKFRYDLHVHTSESSKCGQTPAAELVDMYKKEGYTGIVITDHFFTGNTAVPKDLPWEERVCLLKKGYENAKKRGDETGLDVFYGWEYTIAGAGTDFLTLGLNSDWLLGNPDICEVDVIEYMNRVHEAGGYIIHAHPFAEAEWIPYIRLLPRYEDAVEVENTSCSDFVNERAAEYAKAYDMTMTAGSDLHDASRQRLGGIETGRRMESVADLVETLRRREHSNFS